MASASAAGSTPDCRISLDGNRLDPATDAALTKVDVDLHVDLFGQCVLTFNDQKLELTNGERFKPGAPVKVEFGFAANLATVFEGEVVALEPQFRRDHPISLRVVCQEKLHRLALASMTRSVNNADEGEMVTKVAQEHGLSAEGPSGSKSSILQANTSDATFLRRLAQKQGHHLRLVGKTLILGEPPKGEVIAIGPADGLRKLKLKIKAGAQVSEVAIHGYDPSAKRAFVGKANGEGEVGEGSKKLGGGAQIVFAGSEYPPVDIATAETMAKGRMRKLSEAHVTAQIDLVGRPGLLPGASLALDKIGHFVDGTYRVESAHHQFSRHGYQVRVSVVRTSKATAAKEEQKRARKLEETREKRRDEERKPERKPAGMLLRPRWRRDSKDGKDGKDRATLGVDGKNLAGRTVQLVLETRVEGGPWKEVGKATAEVQGGVATATVELKPLKNDKLSRPEWLNSKDKKHAHGERAEVQLRTTLPDGVEVRMILEQRGPAAGRWEEIDEEVAQVKGGAVKACFDLEHPHHEEKRKGHADLLRQPTWTRKAERHGDSGTISVKAPGLAEGRKVRLIVERQGADGRWIASQTIEAQVTGGAASASVDLLHAQAGPPPPHSEALKKPRWEQGSARPGEPLSASVDAPGLDGHRVRFTFERQGGIGWTTLGAQTVTVSGAVATAVAPPGAAGTAGKDLGRLRFRAELVPDFSPQRMRFRAEPVPDKSPRALRFRGELLVPTDPALTRMRASVEGGGAEPVQTDSSQPGPGAGP